ncbi:MAG: hypothetical protein JWM53_1546 [bacterium]|nr:hypothetical protein [bacterium]
MAETEYLLMLSRDLAYVDVPTAERLLSESNEVSSMLAKLRARVSETLNSKL